MSARPAGPMILAIGLLLGALADALLRTTPWGLNAAVVGTLTVATLGLLQRRERTGAGARSIGLIATAAAAAAAFVWRDAVVLKVLDAGVLAVALALLASEREASALPRTLTGYVGRLAGVGVHTAYGTPLLLACDVPWREVRLASFLFVLMRLLRGLALAVPIVGVLAALLASADAIFAAGLRRVFDVDLAWLLGHAAVTGVAAWAMAGLLRAAVLRDAPCPAPPSRPGWVGLGSVEVAVVLGLVDLLFAAFVWIQLRYLFGGAEWVLSAGGTTYADYARRGFFELVAVVALVLPLLLLAQWLLDPRTRRQTAMFTALAGTQVALVMVMLVSALERMRLYREEYGLTQLRVYTTAFMVWLGALLVWFVVTAMRGRRSSFARGALASAVAALGLLHGVDPERLILETNSAHPRGLDVDYALRLGADAVPALLQALPHLPADARGRVADDLFTRWQAAEASDWRTWSVARARARRELRAAAPMLRELATARQASAR